MIPDEIQVLLQPPRAPSAQLRLESFKTLSRLQLIFEFRPWLDFTREYVRRRVDSPHLLLWDCLCFGAPLNTLLELLGSPTPRHLMVNVDNFDFEHVTIQQREAFFVGFIQRVNLLESQGRLSFGEVLRAEDFLYGGNAGYSRVIQTVNRVLLALQASYPGIYELPHGSTARRQSLVLQLTESERVYNAKLAQIVDSAAKLYEDDAIAHPSLEGFIVNCSRLVPYHSHVLKSLCEATSSGAGVEQWSFVFALHNKNFFTKMSISYRSICANYLTFKSFLNTLTSKIAEASTVLRDLSDVIHRFTEYWVILQAIVSVTSPMERESYDSLCAVVVEAKQMSDSLADLGRALRTMWCYSQLSTRLGSQIKSLDDAAGNILLDDCLLVDPSTGKHYSVFLLEEILLCCTDYRRSDFVDLGHSRYPLRPWEIGCALSAQYPLAVAFSIPTSRLRSLHCIDASIFELTWGDKSECSITFYPLTAQQYSQWIELLEPFVSRVSHSTSVPQYVEGEDGRSMYSVSILTTEEHDNGSGYKFWKSGRRRTSSGVARPWSLIGRLGYRSENSSMLGPDAKDKDVADAVSILSPNLLPTLFINRDDLPKSPLRLAFPTEEDIPFLHQVTFTESPIEYASTEASTITLVNSMHSKSCRQDSSLLDLSENVIKEGYYPIAHGGYSDVWKATWKRDAGDIKVVAVKVLRNASSSPSSKNKFLQRLQQELDIWKTLSHPHVLELCGTVSTFGQSLSMVCPWMKNGSMSKYLEKYGDILTVEERLRFINEVAAGLAYLHSCSIVHGDLTGSNVLIDDDLHVRLSDFGLSTVLREEDHNDDNDNTSIRSVYTSNLGGSVRWADAHLFQTLDDEKSTVIGPSSDIYSFGSVMLEILSGRMPYHYLRTDAQVVIQLHQGIKPRRPASTFVDDNQWDLIQKCWQIPPENRPTAQEVLDITQTLRNLKS
ncbi:kinase-like protein [Agrocybe pediades]|nr:kinase-like protein [Agrocybe pediades]